jgi:hypothetical protein
MGAEYEILNLMEAFEERENSDIVVKYTDEYLVKIIGINLKYLKNKLNVYDVYIFEDGKVIMQMNEDYDSIERYEGDDEEIKKVIVHTNNIKQTIDCM